MLELVAKAAALLALMLGVLYLTLRAKRFEFDRFRSVHTRRKYRVPVEQARSEKLSTLDSKLSTESEREASDLSNEADSRPPPEPPPQ